MYVCACSHVCVGGCCMYRKSPELDGPYLHLLLSILFFETESLTEPGAH